jgi:putative endopeptidase
MPHSPTLLILDPLVSSLVTNWPENGFDNEGLKFDGNGNYLIWWERPIIKRFEIRSECLVQQYSTYTVNELTIDGKLTISNPTNI